MKMIMIMMMMIIIMMMMMMMIRLNAQERNFSTTKNLRITAQCKRYSKKHLILRLHSIYLDRAAIAQSA